MGRIWTASWEIGRNGTVTQGFPQQQVLCVSVEQERAREVVGEDLHPDSCGHTREAGPTIWMPSTGDRTPRFAL